MIELNCIDIIAKTIQKSSNGKFRRKSRNIRNGLCSQNDVFTFCKWLEERKKNTQNNNAIVVPFLQKSIELPVKSVKSARILNHLYGDVK